MRQFITLILALLCLKVQVFSQTTPSIRSQKTSVGNGNDITYSIEQTTDGGYVLAGGPSSSNKALTGSSNDNIYRVVKLDSNEKVTWQRTFGGGYHDRVSDVQQTSDSAYIVAGQTGITGDYNYWTMKLDADGNMIWQKILVGNGNDIAHCIQQTKNGGYIIAGQTGTAGNYDYWLMKLDDEGEMIWQNTFGGTGDDIANSIQQTKDGGYIVAGSTSSNDGDVKSNHGGTDYWVAKLDGKGNMIWQKTLGGSSEEVAKSVQETKDGNYIVAGYTYSNDGDVTSNHGSADYWVVKLDANGNMIWQKTFGGTGDDIANNIQQTTDRKYIVAGSSSSKDGDVTNNHGDSDYWVVKLDANGNLIWQKTLGGSSEDIAGGILQTSDGDYIIAGHTYSNDGDTKNNNNGQDYWIAKLADCSPVTPGINITANPGTSIHAGGKVIFIATAINAGSDPRYQWKKNGIDVGTNINTYIVDTSLKNGDSIYCILTSNAACATTSTAMSNPIVMTINKQAAAITITVSATPNPFKNAVQLNITSAVATKAAVRVTSITGRTVFMQDVSLNTGTNIISVASTSWAAGIYFAQVGTYAETKSCKILKQ